MTERQIADGLAAYLRKENLLFIRARTDRKSTIAEGWPDFSICHCGRCLLIELKTETGKLSEAQQACILSLRSNGNPVEVCFSLQEAVSAVQTWLGVENDVQVSAGPQKQASEIDLSGGTCAGSRKTAHAGGETQAAQSAQNLFLLNIRGRDWVCTGSAGDGGTVTRLRMATCLDVSLPRK